MTNPILPSARTPALPKEAEFGALASANGRVLVTIGRSLKSFLFAEGALVTHQADLIEPTTSIVVVEGTLFCVHASGVTPFDIERWSSLPVVHTTFTTSIAVGAHWYGIRGVGAKTAISIFDSKACSTGDAIIDIPLSEMRTLCASATCAYLIGRKGQIYAVGIDGRILESDLGNGKNTLGAFLYEDHLTLVQHSQEKLHVCQPLRQGPSIDISFDLKQPEPGHPVVTGTTMTVFSRDEEQHISARFVDLALGRASSALLPACDRVLDAIGLDASGQHYLVLLLKRSDVQEVYLAPASNEGAQTRLFGTSNHLNVRIGLCDGQVALTAPERHQSNVRLYSLS